MNKYTISITIKDINGDNWLIVARETGGWTPFNAINSGGEPKCPIEILRIDLQESMRSLIWEPLDKSAYCAGSWMAAEQS